MDRIIEIKVNGSHLSKDSNVAGVQHEANAKLLRIEFDGGWTGYAKTVTFWDALGGNPTHRVLTADLLENMAEDTGIYLCPIPGEAMTEAGEMKFVIDGYDGDMFVGNRPCLTASFKIEGVDEKTLCLDDHLLAEEHGELVGLKLVMDGATYTIEDAGYKGDSEHTILTLDRAFDHPEEGTKLFRPGGKRQRSEECWLKVKQGEMNLLAGVPMDPTPTQAEQLQQQIDTLLDDMAECANRAETAAAQADARADNAKISETNAERSAQEALASENFANGFMMDARYAAEDAQAAQRAAEKAAADAQAVAGGDFVTEEEMQQAIAAGGGGLVVTIRTDWDNLVADKTLAEIVEAHNAGKLVVANSPTLGVYGMPLTGINGNMAVFSHAFNDMGEYATHTFVLMGDGTVDVMSDTYPTKAEVEQVVTARVSKAGDTMTGDLTVEKAIPTVTMKVSGSEAHSMVRKNANASVDYGTNVVDAVDADDYTRLVLSHKDKKFAVERVEAGGLVSSSEVYHQDNKPTPADIGAAPATHNHDAGHITSGTLPVARGGTGVTSLDALATALGAARIASGSYVGTGTYGEANALTLSFNFPVKLLVFTNIVVASDSYAEPPFLNSAARDCYIICRVDAMTTEYMEGWGFGYDQNDPPFGKRSGDGKSVSWYQSESGRNMFNESGRTYHYVAFG